MGLSSFAVGALSGVAGGAGKYQEIQDEQRKFNIDQEKSRAEEARRLNFEKQKKRMDYEYSPSGMFDKTSGRQLSQQERVESQTLGKPLMSKAEVAEEARTKAASQTKAVKMETEGRKEAKDIKKFGLSTSKDWLTSTGDPISNDEAAALIEAGKRSELMSMQEATIAKETRVGEAKDVAAEKRSSKKSVDTFSKRLDKVIASGTDDTIDSPATGAINILNTLEAYDSDSPEYKAAMKKPAVKKALEMKENAPTAGRIFANSTAWTKNGKIDDIRSKLKGKVSSKEIEEVIDYAEKNGYFNED